MRPMTKQIVSLLNKSLYFPTVLLDIPIYSIYIFHPANLVKKRISLVRPQLFLNFAFQIVEK